MLVTIELTREEEARLRFVAEEEGIDVMECARRVLIRSLPALPAGMVTLLANWQDQTPKEPSQESTARQVGWEALKAGLEMGSDNLRKQKP